MSQPVLSMISLGCAKNLVDTERILGAFVERGWLVADEPQDADAVLINTCGFIAEAREESFGAIEYFLGLKEAGVIRVVVVIGCMVQLMRDQLPVQFPGVDAWVGLTGPGAVVDACDRVLAEEGGAAPYTPDPAERPLDLRPRLRVTPRHFAYLRIAEGCDNRCRYCQIPAIRGPLRSKPFDGIVDEAAQLITDGARELIVIAQDTTSYGVDLYGERKVPDLLRALRDLDGLVWLRLLYAHPAHVTDELIAVMAEGGPVLPTIDLPVQHADDAILAAMGRGITQAELRDLIGRIRSAVPDAAIRTTVIVGFPGEGEAEFAELLGFVREMRFDRLGGFTYSREEGTLAAELEDHVPDDVKEERLAAVMELQQEIATEHSEALVGREIDAVVDGKGIDGEWTGRTVRDAPDVDGTIRLEGRGIAAGTFVRACVTEAYGYDLVGRVITD